MRSSDLADLCEAGLRDHSESYRQAVRRNFAGGKRTLISANRLCALHHLFPSLRFGIVSKSPRFWIQTVAEICWPDFQWDVVIGNEDVFRVKPSPEGLIHATQQLDIPVDKTLYVGDSEDDIRAAYAAGMYAVLFTKTWHPWPNLSQENKYLNHTILSFTTSPSFRFYGDVVFDGNLSCNSIKAIIDNKEYSLSCALDSFFNVTNCYFNSGELMFNSGESVNIILTE